jgi:hypothetical protein
VAAATVLYSFKVASPDAVDNSLSLEVYSVGPLFSDDFTTEGSALKILSHLTMPMTSTQIDIDLIFSWTNVYPPASSVLCVIPTLAQSLTELWDIYLIAPSQDIVQVLSEYPYHPNVRLGLTTSNREMGTKDIIHFTNLLREFKHLCHLTVSHDMLAGASAPLVVNQALKSLTLLEVRHSYLFDSVTDRVFRSIKQLAFEWYSPTTRIETQVWFGRNTGLFCTQASNCLRMSSLLFGTTYGGKKSAIKSNIHWDSRFFPFLAINWLHERRNIMIDSHLTGLAVQATNQGVVFAKTTNVIPFDASVSNASAEYVLLRHCMSGKKPRRECNC